MDLLRFLLLLPVRLLRALLHVIGLGLRPLIGNMSWSAPSWMLLVKRKPLHSAGALLALVLLAAGSWFGWQWYQHRPRPPEPQRITWQVKAPELTDYTVQPIEIGRAHV